MKRCWFQKHRSSLPWLKTVKPNRLWASLMPFFSWANRWPFDQVCTSIMTPLFIYSAYTYCGYWCWVQWKGSFGSVTVQGFYCERRVSASLKSPSLLQAIASKAPQHFLTYRPLCFTTRWSPFPSLDDWTPISDKWNKKQLGGQSKILKGYSVFRILQLAFALIKPIKLLNSISLCHS